MRPDELAASLAPPRRGRRALVMATLVVAAAIGAYLVVSRRGPGAPRYRTAAVAKQDLIVRVSAPGALDVIDPVPVPAPLAARVERVVVDEDATVTTGQLLAILDGGDLTTAVSRAGAGARQASAELAAASGAREAADAALARALELQPAGLASAEAIERLTAEQRRARAAEGAARAAVDGARATVAEARARADRVEVRAPVAGVVLRRDAADGAAVRPDGPPLFVIAPRLDVLRLVAEIDEADVGAVAPGAPATFTVPAWPGRTFTATLTRVRRAPSHGGPGVSYGAILDAADPDRVLRPGMSASVTLVVAVRADAVVVPEAALRFSPDGRPTARRRVLVDDGGRLREVAVEPGLSDGVTTEVRGPLHLGDQVVVGLAGKRAKGVLDLGGSR